MEIPFVFNSEIDIPELDETLSTCKLDGELFDSSYTYEGSTVPRTTRVLEKAIGSKELIGWSNRLGLYQRTNYNDFMRKAADIGTFTHERIESTVKGLPIENTCLPFDVSDNVDNAYSAFTQWWEKLNREHNVRVVFSEQPLSCKYCGGTLDLLIELDGKHYLVDFKTSRTPSAKFFYQTASYKYMLYAQYGIIVDGVIILMLGKFDRKYRELVLSFDNPENKRMIEEYEATFFKLVNSYYHLLHTEQMFNTYMKGDYNVGY